MRLGSGRVMKGQLVFEFIIATMFFLAIVIYTISYMNGTVFDYSAEHTTSVYETRAWQASEVLVRSPGVWTGGVPSSIGFAASWPVLDETKIADLNTWCTGNEEAVYRLLDVDPVYHGLKIEVYEDLPGGEFQLLDCGRKPDIVTKAGVTRFAVGDAGRNILRLVVWFW
jgi:hypothetical protein